MTEYNDAVERQKVMLAAEKWAKQVKDVHVHSLSSMWYDDRPQDTANGESVTDTTYNDGTVVRQKNGKVIATFGKKRTGEDLLYHYTHFSGF